MPRLEAAFFRRRRIWDYAFLQLPMFTTTVVKGLILAEENNLVHNVTQ